jgi:Tfp pilus assembly protein PilZ
MDDFETGLPMSVNPRVRDQLILSMRLLTTPDIPDSGSADPFLLTRDLIVSYGAAELALAAICVQLGCVPDKKSICLMDYLDSLGKTAHSESAAQEIDYVAELHEVRSNSHLRSLPPDPQRWNRAKDETLEHVTRWCQQFLGLRPADLDTAPSALLTLPARSSEESGSNGKLSRLALHDPAGRRYECLGSADIRLAFAGILAKGKIANLSGGGCYVVTDFAIEVGEQIEMTLHVNKTSFRVTASVIHVPSVVAAGNRKGKLSGMGVHFTNMSAGASVRLKELIAELKANGRSSIDKRLLPIETSSRLLGR